LDIQISEASKKLRWLIITLRIGLYFLPLFLVFILHFVQSQFFNWETYKQFYLIPTLGLSLSLFSLFKPDLLFSNQKALIGSFLFDSFLIILLQYSSGLQTAIFLFLYIVILIMTALSAGSKSAFIVALFISIGFNLCSMLSPDLKAMTYLFQLFLYNIAFFTVAWISGLLAEQLKSQGISLQSLQILNNSIVETIPSGLLTIDHDYKIVSWNPSAIQIFGRNLKLNDSAEIFLNAQSMKDWVEGVRQDLVWKTEIDNKILSVQILPHSVADQYKLILIDDVTELRQLELQLRHQEKLAAVGGLAAGIAHELGNPLAAVSANIQYLAPKVRIEDESDKKLIENTHKEIARLGRLIGEFKDFAKPEKIPVDGVELHHVLNDVIDQVMLDKSLPQNVKLVRIINEVPRINGSRDKLVQVFMNLIVNAFHAVTEAQEPEVKVVCVIRADFVEVRIADNGIGMSEETKARLFEPFYTTKGRKGTGLGLAISHKILEAHQVRVNVQSQVGQGAEFILQFPVQQPHVNH